MISSDELPDEELQDKRVELVRSLKRVARRREEQMASPGRPHKVVGRRMRELSRLTGASIRELDEIGYSESRLARLHNQGWRFVGQPGSMSWRKTHQAEYVYGPAKRKSGQINRDQGSWTEGPKNVLGGCLFIAVAASIVVTIGGALVAAAPAILSFLVAVAGVVFVAGIVVYFLAAIFG